MLIVDNLKNQRFEYTQAVQNYITTFDIPKFDSENVSVATTCFKANCGVLPKENVPPKSLCHYLGGMTFANHEEFRDDAKAKLGAISTPMFNLWNKCKDVKYLVSEASAPLVSRYISLHLTGLWSGASNQGSVFAAPIFKDKGGKSNHCFATYEEW